MRVATRLTVRAPAPRAGVRDVLHDGAARAPRKVRRARARTGLVLRGALWQESSVDDAEAGEKRGALAAGARDAVAALAEQVRALVDATVSADAPTAALRDAADAVARVVALLRAHVPDPRPPRYPGGAEPGDVAAFFPYDPIVGRLSPLAPPLVVAHADERAVATVTFGTPYEGPPGCVHGGVLAACFDQVFNVANLVRGVAGPTRRLEVRYRKPTPLGVELRFEGWVAAIEGREVTTHGRVLAGDVVTADAEGTFVQVPYERVMKLLETASETSSDVRATPPDARAAPATTEPLAEPEPPHDAGPGAAQPAPASSRAAARRRRFRATGDGT